MLSRFDRAAVSIVAGVRVALGHAHAPTARTAAAATSVLRGYPLPVAHPALPAGLMVHCFCASAFLRADDGTGVGDSAGVNISAPAPAASAGKTRTFWVQRPGPKDPAKLVTGAADVGDLKKEIKKELELSDQLDSISLQLASEDGTLFTAKDAAGSPQPVTLNSMDTIDEALKKAAKEAGRVIKPEDKLRIIVNVAATPAAAAGRWFPDRTDNIDVTDPTIVRRKETCAMVFSGLAEQPVRLLRSPPGSGKTALGELLVSSAPPGRTVKVLNANGFVRMGEGTTAEQFWTDQTGEPMAEALNPRQGPLRTYIIDEVQLLYALSADSSFWRAVKEVASTNSNTCKVQLLLMGTYGLQGGKLVGTPIELRGSWSLKLLLLSEAEVSELFGVFNSTCEAQGYPAVSRSLQLAMERVCGRHVGLLRAALRLFMIAFKGIGAVTRDQEAEFTASQLASMGRGSDLRALPRLAGVSTDEKAILVQVALAGHHGLRLQGAELTVPPRLLSAGVLDLESPGPGQPDVLRFPSPAMRAHALFNLGVRPELALPAEVLSDPAVFVRAAVKRMRSSELAGSLSKAGSSFAATGKGAAAALKTSLLERQYQMSFYSAAVALLPQGVFMSPDFGLVDEADMQRRGYIDFFINGSHRIGIEITRDGKDLQEHTARFDAKTGTYAPLNLRSWVVVDFRQTKPRTTKGKAGTVFVVFSADFQRATIMQEQHKDEDFVLLP